MKGTIIGDIVGSVYEFHNIKTKDFELFTDGVFATDDTVMTMAVANALRKACPEGNTADIPDAVYGRHLINEMRAAGHMWPNAGYGGRFREWIASPYAEPYYSSGNGSAMRVSPVAYAAHTLPECERLARISAEVTHNHPDGICGAQAVAGAVWIALHGGSKEDIRKYVARFYCWTFDLAAIRPTYKFDKFAALCAGTVPYAVQAFLESDGFEDAIRNAISIGGDSDTLAAITGAIAEAFYGVPDEMWTNSAVPVLERCGMGVFLQILDKFNTCFSK